LYLEYTGVLHNIETVIHIEVLLFGQDQSVTDQLFEFDGVGEVVE
jgi:hypothetical protein